MQQSIPVQSGETPVTAALRVYSQIMGFCVIHTTDGVHAHSSLHYVGRAVDLASFTGPSSDSPALLTINRMIVRSIPHNMIQELIYAGPGGICMHNGIVVSGGATYGAATMAEHHNHVHLGVVPGFTYNGGPVPDEPIKTQAPLLAFAPTPTGKGYWIVSKDGAVFSFGDAEYHGGVQAPVS